MPCFVKDVKSGLIVSSCTIKCSHAQPSNAPAASPTIDASLGVGMVGGDETASLDMCGGDGSIRVGSG